MNKLNDASVFLNVLTYEFDTTIEAIRTSYAMALNSAHEELEKQEHFNDTSKWDNLSGQERNFINTIQRWREMHFGESVPHVIRASYFLMIYGLIERTLAVLSGGFDKEILRWPKGEVKENNKRLQEFSGRGVIKSKNYLSKAVGMPLPEFIELDCILLNKLRNAFAHSLGFLNNEKLQKVNNQIRIIRKKGWRPSVDIEINEDFFDTEIHEITFGVSFIGGVMDAAENAVNEVLGLARYYQT